MVIGVDLGGMSAKAAYFSDGTLSGKSAIATSAADSPEETALKIAELCIRTAEKAGKPFDKVQAIGIGAPGVIDSASGVVMSWTNFHWKEIPLAAYVKKYTGKQVFLLNDANAAAYGEAKFGAGKAYADSVLITLGTGVGSGIILGGKLFEGFRSAGGEIGHMVIRQNGRLCSCGRRGCFERYASASALIAATKEAMRRNPQSALWKFASSYEEVDGRTVFLAQTEGDEAAKQVIGEYISALGEGVANIINLLRPQAVILGGGISAEGDKIITPLKEFLAPRMYVSDIYAPLDIVTASLGNAAGLYGAAQYALEKL